jgi:hypothetical protein
LRIFHVSPSVAPPGYGTAKRRTAAKPLLGS